MYARQPQGGLLKRRLIGKVLSLHLIIPVGKGHVGPGHALLVQVVFSDCITLSLLCNFVCICSVIEIQQPAVFQCAECSRASV